MVKGCTKKDATKTKGLQSKVGAPKGNKNAVGNRGNPNPKISLQNGTQWH